MPCRRHRLCRTQIDLLPDFNMFDIDSIKMLLKGVNGDGNDELPTSNDIPTRGVERNAFLLRRQVWRWLVLHASVVVNNAQVKPFL